MPGVRSPLPALEAAAAAVTYDEVRATTDAVWWLESRPHEGGRVALMRIRAGGLHEEVTPPGADVGCDLHGYGGAAYAVDGERVFYLDRRDGHLRVIDGSGARVILRRRHANEHIGDLAAAGDRLWCVRETFAGDELLEVLADGTLKATAALEGFLGSPRPGPGGLAWLQWDGDRMPWDGSELFCAAWEGSGISQPERIAGGRDVSVTQPQWDRQGRLWFVSDQSDWWNLYCRDGEDVVNVAPTATDFAPPEWEAGYRSFALLPGGGAVMIGHSGPLHHLVVADSTGLRPIKTPYTSLKPYLAVNRGRLYAIAASATRSPSVVSIELRNPAATETVIAETTKSSYRGISEPVELRCSTANGATVTALLYPPCEAPTDWCVPLVVRAHPGPTSSVNTRLDWHIQYLTSNGFAVADVDYRGSSGYGRQFRQDLYGLWGIADVQDCIAVAQQLLGDGRTRSDQVFITGASAGGYTALQAVSRPSPFSGAVARSAIIDPGRWQHAAPRWQRAHAAELASPAGVVRADQIRQPVLMIHGSDDHVAPLGDVRQLAQGLNDRGLSHKMVIVDARHSLSAQQAAAQALEAELAFYREQLAA